VDMGEGFEPGAELGLGTPDTARHGTHAAVTAGEQRDDPVRFPELLGPQDDAVVPKETHRTPPRISGWGRSPPRSGNRAPGPPPGGPAAQPPTRPPRARTDRRTPASRRTSPRRPARCSSARSRPRPR